MASTPVVFVHGLWLHDSAWQPWIDLFQSRGYDCFSPGWPGEAATVEEMRRDPQRLAGLGYPEVTAHYARFIQMLDRRPIIVGHSVGGLVTQQLHGMGLGAASVALNPAQFRGVLPLPLRQLRSVAALLGNPANYWRAVELTPRQFHAIFASEVSREESDAIHARYSMASPIRPLFQTALSNLNPRSGARVDTRNPARGPLLILTGGRDRLVPLKVAEAEHRQYRRSPNVTDLVVLPDRGHSMPVDHGWREAADLALGWLARRGLGPEAPAAWSGAPAPA